MWLSLFMHSVVNTRPRQLAWRLILTLRRRMLSWSAALSRRTEMPAVDSLPLPQSHPPAPILPRRSGKIVRRGNEPYAMLLQREFPLRSPIQWHAPDLAVGTRLAKLNLHSMEYLEGLDDSEFQRVIDDWIRHNPPYRRGYWLDDWNSYALSIRTLVWMQEWVRRGLPWASPLGGLVQSSLVAQLRFLEDNLERDIGGNHLLKNIKSLLWAGRFFQGADGWTSSGERLLRHELAEQILPDGMHYERSPAYHAQVFADLLECWHVIEEGPVRRELAEGLRRMAQALVDLVHPDGCVSLFNDGGLHMGYAPGTLLGVYQSLTGGRPGPRAVFALVDAGYFGARGDGELVVVDCGPIAPDYLPAHGHGDILSFEWSLDGGRVVVDAGVFEYDPGERRDWSRATRAHNTLTVDDQDQCEFWGSFRVGRRARVTRRHYAATAQGFEIEGSHDGYRRLPGRPVHRRRVRVEPRRINVRDIVEGGAGQTTCARLLFAPGFRLEESGAGHTVLGDGRRRIRLESSVTPRTRKVMYSRDFGIQQPALQIEMVYGSAPCEGWFTLQGGGPAR